MKKFFSSRLKAIALSSAISLATMAEGLSDLPVKTVNGQEYHYYEVQPKETVYSLTRRLGITTDELYRTNPRVRDGLKAFDTLLFPVGMKGSAPATTAAKATVNKNNGAKRHLVVKGETIIGIGRKYGVTTAQLFEWNPETRDGLRAGQTIYVSDPSQNPVAAPEQTVAEQPVSPQRPTDETTASAKSEPGFTTYTVGEKETFYSIAKRNGLTIAQLEQANPEIGVLHTGDVIRIPMQNSETAQSVESASPAHGETAEQPEMSVVGVTEEEMTEGENDSILPGSRRSETIDIALTLPLMHHSAHQPKQAQLYTEYLKGFLIAVDSMRNEGVKINMAVFDTSGSVDTLYSIIKNPAFRNAKVVVAPDSETQLGILSDYARANDVYVFNPFVVRDETYRMNPHLMQANIPQQQMYQKAIDGLITRYAHCLPVFIGREDAPNDKDAFISELKKRLKETGIEYSDLTFSSRLNRSDLNNLPKGKPYLIIPTSGRQPEANKIFPVLVDFKNDGNDVTVFGYPEWTTFRGETLTNMFALNTVVYSRFFMSPDDSDAARLDGRFVYWFGAPMNNVIPRQGLLGFDSAMFLLNAMKENGSDFSKSTPMREGIQNSFHFVVPDGSQGMVNDVLYFINYRPGETIDRTLL